MRFLSVLVLLVLGCKESVPFWQKTEGGTKYHINSNDSGISPKLNDQLKFHLSIMNTSDSVIVFDSMERIEALEFIYSPLLFNGALREVLPLVQVGDTMLLEMPAAQFYGKSFPAGLNKTDSIQCKLQMLEVISAPTE